MKKNRMMRLASGLLVAVLITTSTISGTFAKYVTTNSANDIARVAEWGVEVTPNGVMFKDVYGTTVDSKNEWKVVAPGTDGVAEEVLITGSPEVATMVTYDATVTLTNWEVEGKPYCPIIFTVEGTEYKIGADEKVSDYALRVEKAIEAMSGQVFNPNTSFAGINYPSVSWIWEFEGEKEGAKLSGYQTDVKDTALGNKFKSGAGVTIDVNIATTVTQVD